MKELDGFDIKKSQFMQSLGELFNKAERMSSGESDADQRLDTAQNLLDAADAILAFDVQGNVEFLKRKIIFSLNNLKVGSVRASEYQALPEEFGSLLRFFRKEAQMTQRKLGEISFVSGSFIAKLEDGQRLPKSRLIAENLARGLQLDSETKKRLINAAGFIYQYTDDVS